MSRRAAPTLRACLLAAAFAAVTACSAADRAVVPGAAAPPAPSTAQAKVRFAIVVHPRHSKGRRHGHYVSPSTKSASIVVGSAAPVVVDLTAGSSDCTGTTTLSCSTTLLVAPGSTTFAVTLYDATGGNGNELSVGTVTQKIVAGQANTVTVVCNGVVASLGLALAQTVPPYGFTQTIPLTVSAYDADHNTIISPGDYENPIEIADGDTSHTNLQVGSGTPATTVTLSDPSQSVSVVYDGSSSLASAKFTASVPGTPGIAAASVTLTPTSAQIAIDAGNGSPAISQDLIGANLPVWTDNTQPYIESAFATNGLHLVRWPGGSFADEYYWGGGGSSGSPSSCNGGYFDPNSTFDNFMSDVAGPANLDVAVTLNYGSNPPACDNAGTAATAAAWVAYSKSKGYNVKYWTVGNENYGSWETDLHASPQDPTTYANELTGAVDSPGYYAAIKAADSTAKVGAVVGGPEYWGTWDSTVLSKANGHFDFVEYHYYAQQGTSAGTGPGDAESDSYLLGDGISDFVTSLQNLRTEMTNNGVSTSVPIYLGELNSIVTTAGKQTTSIVNGLFAGMAVAETMKIPGVNMASWWLAFGDCQTSATGGNFSNSLYGFQNFGTYTLFSDHSSDCGTEDQVTAGTPFPDGRAYAMLSQFVGQSSVVRNVVTSLSTSDVRVYADTLGSGYGILLFNLQESTPETYTIALGNATGAQYTASQVTYDKAIYALSATPTVWDGPSTTSLGTVGTSFSVTLPAWSMNLVTLSPVSSDHRHHTRSRHATAP
jgi:hypothetical protein